MSEGTSVRSSPMVTGFGLRSPGGTPPERQRPDELFDHRLRFGRRRFTKTQDTTPGRTRRPCEAWERRRTEQECGGRGVPVAESAVAPPGPIPNPVVTRRSAGEYCRSDSVGGEAAAGTPRPRHSGLSDFPIPPHISSVPPERSPSWWSLVFRLIVSFHSEWQTKVRSCPVRTHLYI